VVVQLVFVILFAIQHPALDIVGVIAVQIYVCIFVTLKGENRCKPETSSHTGYRADTDSYPRCSWLVEYAVWTDSKCSCCFNSVESHVFNACAYWLQHDFIHGCWPAPSTRDARVRIQIE
jgi:hypothetical protein